MRYLTPLIAGFPTSPARPAPQADRQCGGAAARMGEQPARDQGGLGGVDAQLQRGAAQGEPLARAQSMPRAGAGGRQRVGYVGGGSWRSTGCALAYGIACLYRSLDESWAATREPQVVWRGGEGRAGRCPACSAACGFALRSEAGVALVQVQSPVASPTVPLTAHHPSNVSSPMGAAPPLPLFTPGAPQHGPRAVRRLLRQLLGGAGLAAAGGAGAQLGGASREAVRVC